MNRRFLNVLVAALLAGSGWATEARAVETCGIAVVECRDQLFSVQDIIAADDACAAAVLADATDGCARIFRAATRILRAIASDEAGSDPGTFTDSVKEMLDQFGFGTEGRDLYDLDLETPENLDGEVDLPADSPDGADVQEALSRILVTAIDGSLVDLAAVPPETVIELTPTELDTFGDGLTDSLIEIDLGDFKLFETVLQLQKSKLLLLEAVDVDVDLDSYTPIEERIRIQADIIDVHIDLMTLVPGAQSLLSDASTANRAAIDAYLAASDFIRSEVDDQTDDLITIEPDELDNEMDVRIQLASLRSSLDAPTPVLNKGTDFIPEDVVLDALNKKLGTSFDSQGAILDLGLFYDVQPFDPRDVLPIFSDRNRVSDGSFPDPTFGGILVPEPAQLVQQTAALLTLVLAGWARRQRHA